MSRVCVVDDDVEVLRLLGRSLHDGGHEVHLAASGEALLGLVDSHHYDLLLLDLGLPDMDGVSLLQTLRLRDANAMVVVVSGHDDVGNRVRCLDMGACDFVPKPFELSELLARVRAHLRITPGAPGSRGLMHCGPVALDIAGHRAIVAGKTVSLPPREFGLLKYIMSRPGQVCPRVELLAAVWGYGFETDTNVVDVYISRLRSKIPDYLIETVRNVGYCFVAA